MSIASPSKKVTVLIADDIADTRDNLAKLLYFEKDIEVVGQASDGQQAVELARKLAPDIVLLDVNMPVLDGIAAAAAIRESRCGSAVIMMSVQDDVQLFRQAMLAGAREFLVKPFSGQDLIQAVRRVYEHSDRLPGPVAPVVPGAAVMPRRDGKIITVFSPKGGVGRTTVAVNLAVALRRVCDATVALVDGSLQFGDVGIMLMMQPQKTIVDLLPHVSSLDPEIFDDLLLRHDTGVRVLLAPARPEMAELITPEIFKRILTKLREAFDYVVVDTFPSFHDTMLGALDAADHLIVLFTSEMTAIKNVRNLLDVTHALGYPNEKVLLVVNRADSAGGIGLADVQKALGKTVFAQLSSDYRLATSSLNEGKPFVVTQPRSRLARDVISLAARLGGLSENAGAVGRTGVISRLRLGFPFHRSEPGVKTA
ncbi:MAG: response regulator [Chloroflexi bacterium]|nr:response regulator [Chloroflexota bacterium]